MQGIYRRPCPAPVANVLMSVPLALVSNVDSGDKNVVSLLPPPPLTYMDAVISPLMMKCNPSTPTPLSAQPAAAVPQHQTACRASKQLCRRPGCCNRPCLVTNSADKTVPSHHHYPMLGGHNAASPSNAVGSFVRCRCSVNGDDGMPMSPVLLLPWLLQAASNDI